MSTSTTGLAGKLALGAAATLLVVGVPTAGLAVGSDEVETRETFLPFTPATADPQLVEYLAERSRGEARMRQFTPARAVASGANRSVTVAVRFDPEVADTIASRAGGIAGRKTESTARPLRVTPTRYNLGLARGYESFAQTPALSSSLSQANIPDLSEFAPSPGVRDEPSRFAARIALDEDRESSRRSEARESISDQMLDVAGSYRLSRNIDITAGVRYEQDRDIVPLPDLEQLDSQAVYVGTQFRF